MKYQFLLLTLLPVAVQAAEAVNKAEPNPNADPAAYKLLKSAYDKRQVTPNTLEGFDATVVYTEGPKTATGKVEFRYGGQSQFSVDGLNEEDTKWLKHQVLSIANHRGGGDFDASEGRFPLSFGTAGDTDFGKRIERNDGDGSSCRVRDDKILELTRATADQRFTISISQTRECDPGKYLPAQYVVTYYDKKTGVLQETDLFTNSYEKIGGYWLPVGRKVFTVAGNEPLRSRSFVLADVKIVEKK